MADAKARAEARMAAFDRLPKSVRRALAEANFNWQTEPMLMKYLDRQLGYSTAAQLRKIVRNWEAEKLRFLEAMSGK